MADSNETKKGSKLGIITNSLKKGADFFKNEKETKDSLLNRFTGYKSSPFQLFLLTTIILITMSISASTGGYPLRLFADVVAVIMTVFITIINVIFSFTGAPAVNDYIFYGYTIILTGYLGIILNVIYVYQVFRGVIRIRDIIPTLFRYSFIYIIILLLIGMSYTGNVFGYQTQFSVCNLHQNFENQFGDGDPLPCSPEEFELYLESQANSANINPLLSTVFDSFMVQDPRGNYFRSDDVSRYDIGENAGADFNNLEFSKPYYTSYEYDGKYVAEDLVIVGDISAEKLILDNEEEIIVQITPKLTDRSCINLEEIVDDSFETQLSGNSYSIADDTFGDWCNQEWSCNILNSEKIENKKNTFKLKNNQNSQFTCTRDGLSIDYNKTILPNGNSKFPNGIQIESEVIFAYETNAISTKQLFIVDKEIVSSEENPLSYFNLDDTLTNSKSITDRKINFGIGTLFDDNFIQPNYKSINPFPTQTKIALSIENPLSSNGNVKDMSIELRIFPGTKNIEFICSPIVVKEVSEEYILSNPCDSKDNNNRLSGSFIYEGIEYSSERASEFHKFSLIDTKDISSGQTFVGDVNSVIDSSILASSEYQGMFIEAIAEYKFESSKKIKSAVRGRQ